jgi:DNA/RNA-binding domain of Phe-tRNA-synthetase-like protein
MKTIKFQIQTEILNQYAETLLGFVATDNLQIFGNHQIDENFKKNSIRKFEKYGITQQNYADNPTLAQWRKVFLECGVKPKTYKPSIESLALRFAKSDYNSIIPIVDVYNYVSIGNLVPMGGYDIEKIEDTLTLRFAKEGDKFIGLNGKSDMEITTKNIVYADLQSEDNVVCWQWNHKDGKRTMLTNETKKGLFIIDSCLKQDHERVMNAVETLKGYLQNSGTTILSHGILSIEIPSIEISF